MIVIHVNGQLGNQMFQYALGRKLQLKGRKVRYYKKYYTDHPQHYFGLGRFGIETPEASETQVYALCDDRHRLIDRVRRKLIGRRPHVVSEIEKDTYAFDPAVFQPRNAFVDGYWQSEKYFSDIREVLLKDFTFPVSSNPRNTALAEEMQTCPSVSIHVRRGDYLGGFPVMDNAYFDPAMAYFREKYPDVHFYVFSNDLDWCREHLQGTDVSFVDWNTGEDSLFDMWLMTQCRHNIIANSSFSWWGAWLNTHEGQEVIAPKTWFYTNKTPDVYAKGWKIM